MSYFKHPVFFCCNQRPEGDISCANHAAVELQTYAKDRIAELDLRGKGQVRRNEARRLIAHHFPTGTRVSNPPSGDTLWLELAPGFSSMELFRRCAAEGITFGPGEFFTATDRYRHCLRLNFSGPWNTLHMQALARIGEIAHEMQAEDSPPERRRA